MAFILCVDDEESIAGLVRQVLALAGHEVAVADDGPLALEFVREWRPDLIVLDRSMPGMDGLDVARQLKKNPFLSRIPILMLTALASVDFKVEGFEAGVDDYLTKPFEPRELTARVASLLRLVAREGDRNPSSGLPGGRAIAREIESRIQRGERFSVVYLDFDHFKPFADTFGFDVADLVVAAMGEMLGEVAGNNNAFAAHIGGDDFLLVTDSESAESLARECARRFASIVRLYVPREAAQSGLFDGLSREGDVQKFPLATLTGVVIPTSPASWVSISHLGEAAATWKRAAKANGSGQIVVAGE